jgi:hypothetical protein
MNDTQWLQLGVGPDDIDMMTLAIGVQFVILLALLAASILSATRSPSWHAACRIVGILLYLLATGVASTAGDIAQAANGNVTAIFLILIVCALVGGVLFTVGYFAQVLQAAKGERNQGAEDPLEAYRRLAHSGPENRR